MMSPARSGRVRGRPAARGDARQGQGLPAVVGERAEHRPNLADVCGGSVTYEDGEGMSGTDDVGLRLADHVSEHDAHRGAQRGLRTGEQLAVELVERARGGAGERRDGAE